MVRFSFLKLQSILFIFVQCSDHELSSENDVVSPITSPTLESNSIEIKDESPKSQSFPNAYPLCKECGLKHRISENHEYDYAQVLNVLIHTTTVDFCNPFSDC